MSVLNDEDCVQNIKFIGCKCCYERERLKFEDVHQTELNYAEEIVILSSDRNEVIAYLPSNTALSWLAPLNWDFAGEVRFLLNHAILLWLMKDS